MNYIQQHLQPGEKILFQINRGRKWQQICLTLVVDLAMLAAMWLVFPLLQRTFLESYITPGKIFGRAEFIVINLFLGIVPTLVAAALIYDFICSFFIELALSDRRVFGRVAGLLRIKEISYSRAQIENVEERFHYLVLHLAGGKVEYLSGFQNTAAFVRMFHHRAARPVRSRPVMI